MMFTLEACAWMLWAHELCRLHWQRAGCHVIASWWPVPAERALEACRGPCAFQAMLHLLVGRGLYWRQRCTISPPSACLRTFAGPPGCALRPLLSLLQNQR